MTKIQFKNLPDTSTPLSAENLNQLQTNVENALPTFDDTASTSSTNGVENQAITNYVDGEITQVLSDAKDYTDETQEVEVDSCTLNTNYFSTVVYNNVVRVGKVVTVNISALMKANTSGTVSLMQFPFNFKQSFEVFGFLGGQFDYNNGPVWMFCGDSKYLYIGTNTTLNGKWLHLYFSYIMP